MFYFIDYSLSEAMPSADIPVGGIRTGKFVQIRRGADEYVILAPRESASYHADIVERFCLDKGLAGLYDRGHKRFDIEAPGWTVEGGGKFEIDDRSGRIRLYDESTAYGKFSDDGLKEKLKSAAEIAGYVVQIE